VPLRDASGAACLIPPPPAAWCHFGCARLRRNAVFVPAQLVGGWRDVRRADMTEVSVLCQLRFSVRVCVVAWRLLSRAFTVDAVHLRWCASIR